jgi:hypothetical protein
LVCALSGGAMAPVVKLLSRLEDIKRLDLTVVAAREDDTTKMQLWHSSQTQTPIPPLRVHYSERTTAYYIFYNENDAFFSIKFQIIVGNVFMVRTL